MFLNSQGIKDTNLLECKYPTMCDKAGMAYTFPDIDAQDFPKTDDDLSIVMTFKEEWFKKFINAIASSSVQIVSVNVQR